MQTDKTTLTIAAQNDRFRSRLGIPIFGRPLVPGAFVFTSGIDALPPEVQLDIWRLVREFETFTPDNDPYGEHDFGSLDHPTAGKVFWKIDYYADSLCTYGSEYASDPARTYRILTVMLAEEY